MRLDPMSMDLSAARQAVQMLVFECNKRDDVIKQLQHELHAAAHELDQRDTEIDHLKSELREVARRLYGGERDERTLSEIMSPWIEGSIPPWHW